MIVYSLSHAQHSLIFGIFAQPSASFALSTFQLTGHRSSLTVAKYLVLSNQQMALKWHLKAHCVTFNLIVMKLKTKQNTFVCF